MKEGSDRGQRTGHSQTESAAENAVGGIQAQDELPGAEAALEHAAADNHEKKSFLIIYPD